MNIGRMFCQGVTSFASAISLLVVALLLTIPPKIFYIFIIYIIYLLLYIIIIYIFLLFIIIIFLLLLFSVVTNEAESKQSSEQWKLVLYTSNILIILQT